MSNQNNKISTNNTSENTINSELILYNFKKQGRGKWRVQDDVVMGGKSDSQLKIIDQKYAQFKGKVSLKNDGGFCSIHQTVEQNPYKLSKKSSAFVIYLKGDGKDYNFRVRTPNGKHAYAFTFPTQDKNIWEMVSIPFDKMEATYHGEPVNVANYNGESVVEMQLLIGNNTEETFNIFIETIGVK